MFPEIETNLNVSCEGVKKRCIVSVSDVLCITKTLRTSYRNQKQSKIHSSKFKSNKN